VKPQNNIKSLRKNKGMTQMELAEEIEVSRKTINTIENGVFIPSTVLALKLAKALQVKVEELFWL
jgi:putative transcriptional regulator|tara:strand:+ start:14 stop:208 length:195 start_codon:yes stop_codon:yes gene_type:complete